MTEPFDAEKWLRDVGWNATPMYEERDVQIIASAAFEFGRRKGHKQGRSGGLEEAGGKPFDVIWKLVSDGAKLIPPKEQHAFWITRGTSGLAIDKSEASKVAVLMEWIKDEIRALKREKQNAAARKDDRQEHPEGA